jgi:hypothetical protein
MEKRKVLKECCCIITDLTEHPEKKVNANVGIDKPNTEGNKPAFYFPISP